jgi:two-component system nitrate/nitrite response regulator NarL
MLQRRHSILLVSRSRLLREALRLLLKDAGFEIVGEASAASDALHLLNTQLQPDLVLIDFDVAQEDGRFPDLQWGGNGKLVGLTHASQLHCICREHFDAMHGLVTYDVSVETLVQSLHLIQGGERIFPRSFLEMVKKRSESRESKGNGTDALSPREVDIMRHLARGSSNKSIAEALGIAETTVKVHLKGVLRKIGVPNRTKAALWAERTGFEERIIRAQRNVEYAEERLADQEALVERLKKGSDPEALEQEREVLDDFHNGLERARAELRLQRTIQRLQQ